MRTLKFWIFVLSVISFYACDQEDKKSERFVFLTGTVWVSDSLLVNGQDAGGPGQLLEAFRGEAVFRPDGTGSFGDYHGNWRFAQGETELVITSDALPLPLVTRIEELSAISLKVTAQFPLPIDPQNPIHLRLTFKAK